MSRRACGLVMKFEVQTLAEQPGVQILVVVANIQVGTLKTGAEKGFM